MSCHAPEPGPRLKAEVGPLASTLPNMIISLFLICALTTGLLAFVYLLTKPLIEQIAVQKERSAIQAVVPAFDNEPASAENKKVSTADANVMVFPATKDGKFVGAAVKTYSDKGYAKRIYVMVGFRADGTISGIKVMEQGETPGLGTKMAEAPFLKQFLEKSPTAFKLSVKKDGGDVDAITAATISSRALCDSLSKAWTAFEEAKK